MDNLKSEGPVQEVSEGKNIIKLFRDHSYDVLAMNFADFYLCAKKNLSDATLKNVGLIALAEKISR